MKNEYFKYLCKIQDENFKLISLIKSSFHSNEKLIFEEDFLFTIKSKTSYTFIWENVNIFRASYLFKIKFENYYYSLYQILDFFTKRRFE